MDRRQRDGANAYARAMDGTWASIEGGLDYFFCIGNASFKMDTGKAITMDDALLLERLEAANLTAQVETLASCGAFPGARCQQIGSAVAAITNARFGRKLNHVVGMGLDATPSEAELHSIEEAYANIGSPVEIDFCPFADVSTLSLLGERGYAVNAFGNTYICRDLAIPGQSSDTPTIRVRAMDEREAQEFREWSISGFAAQSKPRPRELLDLLAISAVHREDTVLQIAEIDGQIAGTAAVSIIDLGPVRGAYLHLASTLVQFRGRGVQAALLRARLRHAAAAGASIASVTARPATSSARNAERAGFKLAYTKPTFSRS